MRAIEVSSWGQQPTFNASFPTPPTPAPDSNQVQVRIIAAGLHHLVRALASGKHYAINAATTPLPYIPGSDGVGTTPDGQLVYFNSLKTGGAFSETFNFPKQALLPVNLPQGNASSEQIKRTIAIRIASLFNPAMSSWMALNTRVTPSILKQSPGWTVIILGATSLSGQIAAKLSRHLGAKTIIGVARNKTSLDKYVAQKQIDVAVELKDDTPSTDFASIFAAHKVDIILDYLYGPSALALFNAIPSDSLTAHANAIEYVQIGSVTGQEIDFPSALLRSKNITLRGAGPGAWSVTKDAATYFPGLIERLVGSADEKKDEFGLNQFPGVVERKLDDCDAAWGDSKSRTVFVN